MRVAPNIHLVASGIQGCSLSDDLDCNCWLFDVGGAYVLVDTGAGVDVAAILREMKADGLEPAKLGTILLTHGHADHSGGAAGLKNLLGCELLCADLTAGLLEQGEAAISLGAARRSGVYPDGYVFSKPMPDRTFAPGAPLVLGNATVIPVAAPGHSLDHTCFLVQLDDVRALVTGDALLHSGRIIYQNTYDFDLRQSCETVRALGQLDFDLLLPGHGLFSRTGGRRHVDVAVASLDRLAMPSPADFIQF